MADPKSPPYTDPSKLQLKETLAQQLVPVADGLRDMFTTFGLRPYKIRLCYVQWSGEYRGEGVPLLLDGVVDMLPTPKMVDLTTLQEVATPVGLDELGIVLLTQVSGQFDEPKLMGRDKYGESLPPNIEFFYEIEFLPSGIKRRFYCRSAPQYYAGKFQWQIKLERSREDRARNGEPDP